MTHMFRFCYVKINVFASLDTCLVWEAPAASQINENKSGNEGHVWGHTILLQS
jgi:hypothetical protein